MEDFEFLTPQVGAGTQAEGSLTMPKNIQPQPLISGLPMSTPQDKPIIEGLPISKPEDKPEPTWGEVIKNSLKSGLGQFQASLVNPVSYTHLTLPTTPYV